jgi:hypothetical protein
MGWLKSLTESLNNKLLPIFGWVRRLAIIWPGSILAARGVGPLACRALLLVPRCLQYGRGCQQVWVKGSLLGVTTC